MPKLFFYSKSAQHTVQPLTILSTVEIRMASVQSKYNKLAGKKVVVIG